MNHLDALTTELLSFFPDLSPEQQEKLSALIKKIHSQTPDIPLDTAYKAQLLAQLQTQQRQVSTLHQSSISGWIRRYRTVLSVVPLLVIVLILGRWGNVFTPEKGIQIQEQVINQAPKTAPSATEINVIGAETSDAGDSKGTNILKTLLRAPAPDEGQVYEEQAKVLPAGALDDMIREETGVNTIEQDALRLDTEKAVEISDMLEASDTARLGESVTDDGYAEEELIMADSFIDEEADLDDGSTLSLEYLLQATDTLQVYIVALEAGDKILATAYSDGNAATHTHIAHYTTDLASGSYISTTIISSSMTEEEENALFSKHTVSISLHTQETIETNIYTYLFRLDTIQNDPKRTIIDVY